MLIDLINNAKRNSGANGRDKDYDDYGINSNESPRSRKTQPLSRYGGSRLRSSIISGASLLAGLLDATSSLGEIQRIDYEANRLDTGAHDYQQAGGLLGEWSPDTGKAKAKIEKKETKSVTNGFDYRENQPIFDSFFNEKSISPNNNFTVTFGTGDSDAIPEEGGNKSIKDGQAERIKMIEDYGNMPIVRPWHVKNISVPILPTEIKVEKQFTYAFPTVDIKSMEHKFSITFQEDKIGTIFTFIQWAYSKIINPSGEHYSQSNNRIGWCRVNIMNPYTMVMTEILFQDVFLLSAGQLALDYSSNNPIEYAVEFQASSKRVKTIPIVRKSPDAVDVDKSKSSTSDAGQDEVKKEQGDNK
jgi:hypothetical protein